MGVGVASAAAPLRTPAAWDRIQEPPFLWLRRSEAALNRAKGGPSSAPKLTRQEAGPQQQQQRRQQLRRRRPRAPELHGAPSGL